MKKIKKVSFNLPEQTMQHLAQLSEETNVTMTSLVISAVNLEMYLRKVMSDGGKVVLEAADGSKQTVVFL